MSRFCLLWVGFLVSLGFSVAVWDIDGVLETDCGLCPEGTTCLSDEDALLIKAKCKCPSGEMLYPGILGETPPVECTTCTENASLHVWDPVFGIGSCECNDGFIPHQGECVTGNPCDGFDVQEKCGAGATCGSKFGWPVCMCGEKIAFFQEDCT